MVDLKREYGAVYRVFDDRTDDSDINERIGCQEIRGAYGCIYFHGKGLLAVYTDSVRISNRLERMGLAVKQRGDFETVFLFDPKDIHAVAAIIQAQKKRQLSDSQKAMLTARFKSPKEAPAKSCLKTFMLPQEGSSLAPGAFLPPT